MPIALILSTPLRRLVAAVLALSVLLTTLGWVHPACDVAERGDVTSPIASHAGASHAGASLAGASHAGARDAHGHERMHGRAPAHATDAATGERAGGCPDHDRHHGPDGGECALVAHCAAAVVPTGSDVPIPMLVALTGRAVPDSGRPLERPHQPEAPPPKV